MNKEQIEALVGPRWQEIEEYAAEAGITYGEAVITMINRGLSYTEFGDAGTR